MPATVSLIGNGTILLLTNPEQLSRLRADLAKVPAAVDELVRLVGPADVAPFRYSSPGVLAPTGTWSASRSG